MVQQRRTSTLRSAASRPWSRRALLRASATGAAGLGAALLLGCESGDGGTPSPTTSPTATPTATLERMPVVTPSPTATPSPAATPPPDAGVDVEVQGDVAPAFQAVADAFERNFREYGDLGASVSVTVDGEPVVDLWAGHTDPDRSLAWERDTIVNVYSTTKGLVALCAHLLADRGALDLDAPVARYWPEFGQDGKESIPVRWLLTHQAGLAAIDGIEQLPDGAATEWQTMVEALERTQPQWEPGSAHGYHMVTFGWLVGEVVRRAAGVDRFRDFFHDEVAGPLDLDCFIGTPVEEHARIAGLDGSVFSFDDLAAQTGLRIDPDSLVARAAEPASERLAGHPNSAEWREAEIAAANGHTNARAIARVYGALARGGEVDGVRLLSEEAIERARAEQVSGPDRVVFVPARRSLGFMLPGGGGPRSAESFGHSGLGGSNGFADPVHRLGFGFAMNRMWDTGPLTPDPRARSLIEATYQSLG